MRWFKHMTKAWDDEKMANAVDIGGLEVYGLYFRLIEIVASNMEKNAPPVCEYSAKRFARLCNVLSNKFQRLSKVLAKCKLITLSEHEGLLKVEINNIIKYRDEYSVRSKPKKAKYRDTIPTVSGQTPEQDTDTDTDTDIYKINNKKSKKSTFKSEEKASKKNTFLASDFLANPEIENPKLPITSGKIDKSAKVIHEFANAFGAFTLSEIEKANVCKLIDKGCVPKDVSEAKLANSEYMKSLKSEFAMRCVIAAKDKRLALESPRNQTQEEIVAEAKRLYGNNLLVV